MKNLIIWNQFFRKGISGLKKKKKKKKKNYLISETRITLGTKLHFIILF